jgi:hypothetical protein
MCCLTLVGTFSLAPVAQAQTGSTVVCDSTLITLLFIAERDYGFKSMSDVSTIEKGQYSGLFQGMMSGGMMATPEAMMPTQEGMATQEGMMPTQEGMMPTQDAMGGSMVQLLPGVVPGENPACTALRAELEAYLLQRLAMPMTR